MPQKAFPAFRQISIIKRFSVTLIFSLFILIGVTTTNTHAAGVANIRDIFGAVGDGIADDSEAIIAAFASDYDTIVFPKGEYRYTRVLSFGTGNKTIIGEEATLFTDDDFSATTGEFSIRIQSVSQVKLQGLRFETRQTENDAAFKTVIGVLRSSEIHFDSCDFLVVPGSSEPMLNAVDFYTAWHNVSVTNSRAYFYHDNDGEGGGGFFFRDLLAEGASNAKFINNSVYKYSHDEIFWIAEGLESVPNAELATIENIEISGNRFYMGEPVLSNNVYTISIVASGGQRIVKNIQIHDNEIIGQGTANLINLRGVENIDIYNNDLYAKVTPANPVIINGTPVIYYSGSIVGSPSGGNPNTPETVKVHNNRTVTLDSPVDVAGVTLGTNPFDFADNPRVIINAPNTHYLINHRGKFSNNNVTVNGNAYRSDGGGIISSTARNVQNNNILINGFADVFIRNYGSNLAEPVNYIGNTITTTKKLTEKDGNTRLVHMWNFFMGGYPITIRDNTFTSGSEVELNDSIEAFTVADMGSNTATDRSSTENYSNLWWFNIADSVPIDQTAYFCNNTTRGFRNKQPGVYPTLDLDCD